MEEMHLDERAGVPCPAAVTDYSGQPDFAMKLAGAAATGIKRYAAEHPKTTMKVGCATAIGVGGTLVVDALIILSEECGWSLDRLLQCLKGIRLPAVA